MIERLVERMDEIGADYSLNGENGILVEIPGGFRVSFMEELKHNFKIEQSYIYPLELDSFGNARRILVVFKRERRD